MNGLRKINTGHPEAANQLISDNVKEMSNPTRDGRAMIAAGRFIPPRRQRPDRRRPLQASQSALFNL